MSTQKRKSHVKQPHIRHGHYVNYWYMVKDMNGDVIYDAYGKPLKEKRKRWLDDIKIHADGPVQLEEAPETNQEESEEKSMLNPSTFTNANGRAIRRGEIYYVKKSAVVGSEQEAGRPALVVSNNAMNATSQTVEIVYLTTQPKRDYPTHVACTATGMDSTILCEQINAVSLERVGDYITTLTPQEMKAVDLALCNSIDLEKYITAKTVDEYYEPTTSNEGTSVNEDKLKEAMKAKAIAESKADRLQHDNEKLKMLTQSANMERDMYKQMYERLLDRVVK